MADRESGSSFGWYVLVALVMALILTRGLTWIGVSATWTILVVGALAGVGLLTPAVRRSERAESSPPHTATEPATAGGAKDAAADDHHSVWNLLPPWQYDGRHAESGGLTRGEQERSLREIQAQAAEIERRRIAGVDGDDPDPPDP